MTFDFQRYAKHEHPFIQMTAQQSDYNGHKSEHETSQLRYLTANLRVQARED